MPFGVGLLAGPNVGLAGAPDQGLGIKFATTPGNAEIRNEHPVATVFTRASWADDWTEQPDLYVRTCRFTDGSQIGQATLLYEYGQIMRQAATTFSQENPKNLNGHWVKIEFTPQTGEDVIWLGVVTQDQRKRFGSPEGKHAGDQVLSCSSVEWLLSKYQVTTSRVGEDDEAYVINRGLTFNEPFASKNGFGNRSEVAKDFLDIDDQGYYTFADTPMGQKWDAAQIVIYLLREYEMFNEDGPTIKAPPKLLNTLQWYIPKNVETHGRTLYEILRQMISERFGLAWSLVYDGTDIEFKAWSYNSADITLPSGVAFPKNAHPIDIDFDDAIDVEDAMEIRDIANTYTQVKVQGARRGSVVTLSLEDGSLEKGWTDEEQTEYFEAAAGTPGFELIPFDDQITAHDRFRAGHRMRHVWTSFRIPDDWDGMLSNIPGNGGSTEVPAFPSLDEDGDPTTSPQNIVNHLLRIDPDLALRQFYDYSGVPSAATLEPGRTSSPGYLRTFAMWRMDTPNDKWADVSRLSDFGKANGIDILGRKRSGLNFDASLDLWSHAPGLSIVPNTVAHIQAGETWNDDNPSPSWTQAEVDYQDYAVTCYIQQDSRVEEVWPDSPLAAVANQQSVLLIELGDEFRLDWLCQGTIIGMKNTGEAIRSFAGFVRDDRPIMKDIARILGLWHLIPRVSFRVAFKQITGLYSVGMLVQQVGSRDTLTTVNSLITAVDYDFEAGTTQITTSFTETLDALELV